MPARRRLWLANCPLILAICLAAGPARAEGEDPTSGDSTTPADPGPTAAAGADAEPVDDTSELTADDLRFLDPAITGEAIMVWDERPDKPFDRDTQLRLTGEELARRGATTLADALDLLPDVVVREAGRGGRQIEVRGSRKGSVKILIDGVSVADPFYGNLDISAIPVTDIVEIRVSSSPASPIDGVGGPGGVIEIHTRDAVGGRLVVARVSGTSLPSAEAAATARTALGERWAARMSASGALGLRDFEVMNGSDTASMAEGRKQEVGALRLEYRHGARRVVTDGWLQHGAFLVPPGADDGSEFLFIESESQARVGVQADDHLGRYRLQGRAFAHYLARRSSYYTDPELTDKSRSEDLSADRAGATVVLSRPLGPRALVVGSTSFESEHAEVDGFDDMTVTGRASVFGAAAGLQLADGPWKVDGAAGVAVPIGLGASPWPELKLVLGGRLARALTVELSGGHKGRTPTLRERFNLATGNEALGPERAWYGEAKVVVTPSPALRLSAASYQRWTTGIIRFDADRGALINSSELNIRGVDAQLEVRREAAVGGGASYGFVDAHSPELGSEVLDFLPRHRLSAWLDGRVGRYGGRLRGRYQSDEIDRNQTLPGYGLVDVSLFGQLGSELSASLRLDNLLGKTYDERAGVRSPGRVVFLSVEGKLE